MPDILEFFAEIQKMNKKNFAAELAELSPWERSEMRRIMLFLIETMDQQGLPETEYRDGMFQKTR